ncbi:PSP1-domain-containing protein [Mytilinidion resinicola]|uniref:PSP1-domain-containing protein n=1 Tax=Mytilinidion resinicola TaxID=574789 RepID=A0A6A6YUQ0_9PEZI|nr:PSP1-domain-containing protein [Mytilinidion resinicola]KAF2812501.1 PSP1-domain-containing protein [Mytilinidion resinicola]
MSHAYKKSTQSYPGTAGTKADKQQARRPTPDSEVLASSDEDTSEHVLTRVKSNPLTARRQSSSWLNDIQPHRKVSLSGASQTGNSQPPTPSVEQGTGQPRTGSVSFPWNAASFTSARDGLTSPTVQEQADPTIGFLLNQKPVRKAVRSLSYSVGQQDDELLIPNPSGHFAGRGPRLNSTSVRHRPSKPSLLGEAPLDSSGLPQLLEDEDDMNSGSTASEGGLKLPASHWAKPDSSAEASSNALLRQAAEQNARARHRASTTGSPPSYNRKKTAGPIRGLSLTEFDSAIEEMEDQMEELSYNRRYSENVAGLGAGLDRITTEAGIIDSPKKPHWATSLSFGDPFGTHSRRHSFADVKSHQGSKTVNKLEHTDEEEGDPMSPGSRFRYQTEQQAYTYASQYFDGTVPKGRKLNEMLISAMHPDPYEEDMPGPSNSSNPYAVPEVINRPTRRFYMVAFKCSRSDVYYLPENTGLELQQGDMVITEGDRGIDLGTVTHADVTLTDAKRYKEIASIEHFRWLMMFSRTAMNNGSLYPGPDGMLATTHQPLATALGQMTAGGTTLPQQYVGGVDMELKPRIIRRVAATHEVQVLREKEGSEAKAKRICQAKVAEHGLNMEILDAEYQLDYKKLTFYYYADAYINFNELVTDLFKVYKTRIWMSAVNPASFASAIGTSIPPPSAIGPGAIGSKDTRSNAPLRAMSSPQDFNAPLTSTPLPIGLGYTRNVQYNDEFGSCMLYPPIGLLFRRPRTNL